MFSYVSALESDMQHADNRHTQANLLGSVLGLWVGFTLERYYRHRREVIILPTVYYLSSDLGVPDFTAI
jgi:hypothetical protein